MAYMWLGLVSILSLPLVIPGCFVPAKDPLGMHQFVASQVYKLTPFIETGASGTGFTVKTEAGETYTLTNSHVCNIDPSSGFMKAIDDAHHSVILQKITVEVNPDLCLLSPVVFSEGLPLAEKDTLYQPVSVIGHPLGDALALTTGYLGAMQRDGDFEGRVLNLYVYLGNSGSPVVNAEGEVVSVVFATDTRTGYGYGVPLAKIKKFLERY